MKRRGFVTLSAGTTHLPQHVAFAQASLRLRRAAILANLPHADREAPPQVLARAGEANA